MDPHVDNSRRDQQRLDLLVDGELNEAQRAELLAGLDQEPDGWRRCALAFLEAQCWKQEMRAVLGDCPDFRAQTGDGSCMDGGGTKTGLSPLDAPSYAAPVPRTSWRRNALTAAAMAASFFAALVIGTHWRGGGWTGPTVGQPSTSNLANTNPRGPEAAVAMTQPQPTNDQWETVTLTSNGGPNGQAETFRMPAVHRDRLDEQWIKDLPEAIPPDMRQAFERSGHEILQHRELVPMEMNDGRKLIVPVDRIEVRYVGRPAL